MPITVLGGTKAADTTFSVANSCRFNDGDAPYMSKTNASSGSATTWTFSCWVKRSSDGEHQMWKNYVDGSNYCYFRWEGTDELKFSADVSGATAFAYKTSMKFLDVTAWYNIVVAVDTTQGVAGNRVKIYVNGTQVTAFATETDPDQNAGTAMNDGGTFYLGSTNTPDAHFDGYMAEVVLIDGTQLAATSFGEFDETSPTIWKPIDVSGLTFGTNGFYLDFEASDNLGNDANGGTDLGETNIAAVDSATDTPTNNFCTLNPLIRLGAHSTLSEGNCLWTLSSAGYESVHSTFLVNAGKWYCEFKFIGGTHQYTGITAEHLLSGLYESVISGDSNVMYNHAGNKQIGNASDGAAQSSYGSTYTEGDIVGMALDYDNNFMYYAKNNTWQNSGDPESGATGTGGLALPSTTHAYAFGMSKYASSVTGVAGANFGGCPPFALSSAESDANGYGAFEYAPPAGYLSLCTKNLGSDGG